MKLSWGYKIALLYAGFVALIITLVVASSKQHFDLVSANYYADEIAYQKVIDADKNQTTLSSQLEIHADAKSIIIAFPVELKGKALIGSVYFYSPVNAAFDKKFIITETDGQMKIDRNQLKNMVYTVKVNFTVDGEKYYQESEINLHS